MLSQIVGSIAAVAISGVMMFGLYVVGIAPLVNYDIDSFYADQTKSSVYNRALLSTTNVTDKKLNERMFTRDHLFMLPAVDVNTGVSNRLVLVYAEKPNNFQISPTGLTQQGDYPMSVQSIYDKSITFNGYNNSQIRALPVSDLTIKTSIGFGEDIPPDLFDNYYGDSVFNATIDGRGDSDTLMFYREFNKER